MFLSGIFKALPYTPKRRKAEKIIKEYNPSNDNSSSDQIQYESPTESVKSSPDALFRTSKHSLRSATPINNKRLSEQLTSHAIKKHKKTAGTAKMMFEPMFFEPSKSKAATQSKQEEPQERKPLFFPQIDEFLPQKPEQETDDEEVPKNSRSKFLQMVKDKSRHNVMSFKKSKQEMIFMISNLRTKITESMKILDLAISSCGIDQMCLSLHQFSFGSTDESYGKLNPEKLQSRILDFLGRADPENFVANDFLFQLPYNNHDSKTDSRAMEAALGMWCTGKGSFPAKFHDHHVLLNEKTKFQACLDCLLTIEQDENVYGL